MSDKKGEPHTNFQVRDPDPELIEWLKERAHQQRRTIKATFEGILRDAKNRVEKKEKNAS